MVIMVQNKDLSVLHAVVYVKLLKLAKNPKNSTPLMFMIDVPVDLDFLSFYTIN